MRQVQFLGNLSFTPGAIAQEPALKEALDTVNSTGSPDENLQAIMPTAAEIETLQKFKTPLISIVNLTELMRQDTLTDEQKNFAETIEKTAADLLTDINSLVEQLRQRARQDAQKDATQKPFRPNFEQSSAVRPNTVPLAVRSNLRVLVVEDNPVLQLTISKQLHHLGVKTACVGNGKAAVDAVEPGKFDLIFMDCQMPILDGFEATKEIRKMERGTESSTRIVALTAGYEEQTREKCLEAGMDGCLIKPAAIDDLRRTIEMWFGKSCAT